MLTYEQRLELLKKAREAKKNKKLAKIAPEPQPTEPLDEVSEIVFEEEVEPTKKVKKPRAKSVPKSSSRTLDIPAPMPDFVDSEPEVEEQIIYKPKEKKKKKLFDDLDKANAQLLALLKERLKK